MTSEDGIKHKANKSIRLPRISPVTRLILFVGIFLIMAIPLFLIFFQQQTRQAELNHQYSILQKALEKQEAPEVIKKKINEDIEKAEKGLGVIKTTFPKPDQSPEIIDSLLVLAKSNGIEITKALVTTSRSAIKVGADNIEYPVLNFDISLKGQVPKFQNFLLDLNSKFPTSELKKVYFRIPEVEEEEDTANIVLSVCGIAVREAAGGEIAIAGKKPVITFTDKKDKTTDLFKIKGSKWRIDWKATASDAKWSGLTLVVYRKGETGRYVDIISPTGGNPEGTGYLYEGEGEFYLKVITANISNWEIRIYE